VILEVIIMKKIILLLMTVTLLIGGMAAHADDEDVFWGALLGAGAGLILGETIDGIHGSVAVPIGAIAGGLIGHELDRTSYRYGWYDHYPVSYRYRPYGCYGRRVNRWPQSLYYVEPSKPKVKRPAKPSPKAPDYHPGVDVVKVQIRLVNGSPMDVRLLRMPDDTFVGPQGETYKALPKASELTRYAGP